jgi:HK97 family phage major capsid protein
MITPAALREISQLQHQAETLLSQRSVSRADAKRADLVMAKIASIRQAGYSSDEQRQLLSNEINREIGLPTAQFDNSSPEQRAHESLFRRFLAGATDSALEQEQRATLLQAGQQTVVFTQGSAGGFLVPQKFSDEVVEARAAVDPMFSPDVVTLIQEDSFTLPPLTVSGWDLSTITATKVGETTQQTPGVIPNIDAKLLGKFTYRASISASLEFDADSKAYGSAENALARAFGVAFGRSISSDLVLGDGTTGPQGIVSGAVNAGITTAAAGKLGLTDFTGLFYSVNAAYRNAPKAAWLLADSTHKMAAEATDNSGRPLFPIVDGVLTILGRPAYSSPSMPSGPGSKGIIFGDLGAMHVHSSSLLLRRLIEVPGIVEFGRCIYHGLQMVDARVCDPSEGANSGAFSPVKYALLHS